ncbi:hypothetical protein CEXT_348411, partial [Caerostris extrusa]
MIENGAEQNGEKGNRMGFPESLYLGKKRNIGL